MEWRHIDRHVRYGRHDFEWQTPAQPLWLWILGVILSVIALAFAVRGVHWPEVWEAIRNARIELVVLGLVTVVLTTVAKAMRWRWLLFQNTSVCACVICWRRC